jgi:hypothetical protein
MTVRVVKIPVGGAKLDVAIALTVADTDTLNAAIGLNHIAFVFQNTGTPINYTHCVALDSKMTQLANSILEDAGQTDIAADKARVHAGSVNYPSGENTHNTRDKTDTLATALNGKNCALVVLNPDPTTSGISYESATYLMQAIKERMSV